MNLTRFLVGRPLLTSMFFGSIVLLGIASVIQLPISNFPDIDYPFVIVQLDDQGANATAVKHDVTDNVEDALSQLGSVRRLTGISSVGSSTVVVELLDGTDVNTAATDIAQAINRSARLLPTGVGTPSITKINPSAVPALVVNFSGTDLTRISDALDKTVVPALRLVDGVGQVSLVGDRPTVTDVVVDADRLNARGLSIAQITQAITSGNVTSAAGAATSGNVDSQVRITDQATTSSELAGLVIGSSGTHPVRLSEVATLRDGPEKATSVSRLNGLPTVGLQIIPKTGANVLQAVSGAKKALDSVKGALPAGTTMAISTDTSVSTSASVSATAKDLVFAVLLASLVVLLFLQSFRQTLIVLVAIPTSLLATTFMMRLFDFSIDVVSLLGMSLLIGILVDDAVVVIENITRHLGMGQSRVDAAVEGRTEIGGAAVALTLVDIVVFTPIVVAPGLVGKILIEMSLTVVVATLFSLLVSFTLTPMLSARWLKPPDPTRRRHPAARFLNRTLVLVEHGYIRVLHASLRHRITVLFVGVCLLATAVGLAVSGRIGAAVIPDTDTNELGASISLPAGTSLASSGRTLSDLSARLQTIPDVLTVYGTTGSVGFMGGGASSLTVTMNLVDKHERAQSVDELKRRVGDEIARFPGARGSVYLASGGGGGGGGSAAGLPILLTGPDLTVLDNLSTAVAARLGTLPELTNVNSDAASTSPSWDITMDKEAAGRLGVTSDQILAAVSAATDNAVEASSLRTTTGRDQKIRVSLAATSDGLGLAELQSLPVAVKAATGTTSAAGAGAASAGGAGAAGAGTTTTADEAAGGTLPPSIKLGQVASIKRSASPETINDENEQPQVTVSANPAPGVASSAAQQAITNAMKAVTLPAGYTYQIGGQAQNQSQAFLPLVLSIGLSPILIYMLLAALYESFVLPFAVLLAQPLAVLGALIALIVGKTTINLFSLIGLVLLIGLVSKNGILLIDRTENKRREGLSAYDALTEAGRVRLRPILMTSMTLVVAMLPIALSTSSGSEFRAPLALVLIGGMSSSTILTLVIVPTLYTVLDGARERLPRGMRGLLRGRIPQRVRHWLHEEPYPAAGPAGFGGPGGTAGPGGTPAGAPGRAPDTQALSRVGGAYEPDTDPEGLGLFPLRGGPVREDRPFD
jgi:HAE1 family hydrophobic/amphiphilic exporter-1